MNKSKHIIVPTDLIHRTGHAQAPGFAQSPQTYNILHFSGCYTYPNADAVYATCTADSKTSRGTDFRFAAAKAGSGGLRSLRATEPLHDSQPVRFLALKATGPGWCDEN
jgi:hypothetical protein